MNKYLPYLAVVLNITFLSSQGMAACPVDENNKLDPGVITKLKENKLDPFLYKGNTYRIDKTVWFSLEKSDFFNKLTAHQRRHFVLITEQGKQCTYETSKDSGNKQGYVLIFNMK